MIELDSKSNRLTRDPISIFHEIKDAEDEKKKKLNELLEGLKKELPNNFKIGASVGEGDCFFDSVAQGLNECLDSKCFNVRSLRKSCNQYAREELKQAKNSSWLNNALEWEGEKLSEYVPRIEFTAEDIKNGNSDSITEILQLKSAIWGRLEIEGKMICKEYKVKIQVIELRDKKVNELYITTGEVGKGDVVYIVNYRNHFVPLLNNIKKDIEESVYVSGEEVYGIENENLKNVSRQDKSQYSSHNKPNDILKLPENFEMEQAIQARPSWISNPQHIAGYLKKSLHGNDYQLKLLMLFAYKGGNFEVAFRLATEMSEAEKFDDLVFRYTNSEGVIRYRFLQAKHRQFLREENKIKVSDLKSNSDQNDFSLQKYFVSYLIDIQKWEFQDGVPQDFIICTNTGFDFEPSTTWKGYFSEKKDEDEILNLGGKHYQFCNDPIIRGKIISELELIFEKSLKRNNLPSNYINKTGEFLDKLVFAVEQPSGAILEQKIKKMIGDAFNLINDITYNDFFKFMSDWMQHLMKDRGEKGEGRACFLTGEDVKEFFDKAKQKIASLGIISSTLLYKVIEKSGVEFKDNIQMVQEVNKFLNNQGNQKKPILIIYQESVLLSRIKVCQVLASQNTKVDRYIFSNLKSLSLLIGSAVDPICAFSSEGRDHLIIEHDSILNEGARELLKSFYQVLVQKPSKRIIFITPYGCKNSTKKVLSELFNELSIDENEKYMELEDKNNCFNDLTLKSQRNLLQGKVIFQEEEVSLDTLIDEESKHLINAEVLSKLINNEKIEIGIKRPDLSDLESIYYVTCKGMKEEQFFSAVRNNSSDLFVISGTTKAEFGELIVKLSLQEKRVRLLGQDDPNREDIFIILTGKDEENYLEDFKRICSYYPGRTAHLIEKKGSKLTWQHSYDASFYISRKLYHVVIDKYFLQADIYKKPVEGKEKKDIFAISSIGKNKFKEQYEIEISMNANISTDNESAKKNHVIILNGANEKESFEELCNQNKLEDYYNIHWLQNKKDNDNDKLVWKCSKGKIDKINNLKDTSSEFSINENDLNKIIDTEKAVIIAGEPGMGKSTTLTHLLKQPEEFEWIIKFNLIKEQLEKFSVVNDLDSIIEEFFSKADIGVKAGIAKGLLKHRIEHQGKITLLFDGFDEITNENQETVIKLLTFLKDTRAKIQVTTRLHMKDKLENALSILSYTFQPFSKKDQKEFLQKFWKASFKLALDIEVNNDTLGKNVKALFDHFYQNISDKKYELMSIPLLTRMFAEIYQEIVEDSYHSGSQVESRLLEEVKKLSMFDLYEKFIERKYEIYFREKMKIKDIPSYVKNKLTKSLNKDHQRLAFHKLFSKLEQTKILADELKLPSQEEEKNLKLVGIIQSRNSKGDHYFIHQTFAEYFAAGLLVDMIGRREDNSKYKLVHEFLLKQIFIDRNKVIRNFFENMVQKGHDDYLNSKWKAIQDCDLLRKIKIKKGLQLFNLPSVIDSDMRTEVQQNDAVSKKCLSKLKKDVESCMKWEDGSRYHDGYYFNGNPELINKIFQGFFKEMDVEKLKATLEFLIKVNGKSYLTIANMEFSKNDNIINAIEYYVLTILKNKQIAGIGEAFKYTIDNRKEKFQEFKHILDKLKDSNLPNEDQKKKCMENLVSFLIPKGNYEIIQLANLNNYLHYFFIFYQNTIEDINCIESIQKKYTEGIINFLRNVTCGNNGVINVVLKDADLKSLQSFFIDVTHHPNIIGYTKSSINIMYKNGGVHWLERQGILISRLLKILTPEMSKAFNSCLDRIRSTNSACIYSSGVCVDFISYVLDTMEIEDLPQIDRLAFLKMIVSFTDFTVTEQKQNFPFTSNQLKTTLGIIEDVLNKQHKPALEVFESVKYFFILGKVGLKFINADQKLLVLDPVSEFQYELSSFREQIVELIDWKLNNHDQPGDAFIKKCYKVVELRKSDLKRSRSENNLQELTKRFKNDIQ